MNRYATITAAGDARCGLNAGSNCETPDTAHRVGRYPGVAARATAF